MSSKNGGKIYVWELSHRAKIYPHLELEQRAYTQKEMRGLCNKLKEELPNLNIIVYEQSSYCYELNGPWNVCFAVGDSKKGYAYTYIIRSDEYFNKTYGCSFINSAYIPDLKINGLTKKTNGKIFDIIESKLMELMPNSMKVNYFDT